MAWRRRTALGALAAAACFAGPLASAHAADYRALVVDEANASGSGANLSTVDLGADPPVGASPVSLHNPFDVVISPDANTAYVADGDKCGNPPTGNAVVPIDLTTSPVTAKTPINLGSLWPFGMTISPDGTKLYAGGCGKVASVDLTTSPPTVGTPIAFGGDNFGAVVSQDGKTLWVADHLGAAVGVIDVSHAIPAVVKTITVGSRPLGMALSPDGAKLYVANGGKKSDGGCTISVIDTVTETAAATPIALPDAACSATPQGYFGDPGKLTMSPNGSTLYAASVDAHVVTPVSTATGTAGTPISFAGVNNNLNRPFAPGALAVTPDGERVIAGDGDSASTSGPFGNDAQLISTSTNALLGSPVALHATYGFGIDAAVTPDQAPVADFAVTSAPAGSATTFDASTSTVRFGAIASYAWDFGDGTPVQTTPTATTAHAYAASGTYAATVTETDFAGTSLPASTLSTGRTLVRHGSDTARASRSVIIAAGPQPAVSLSASSLTFATTAVGKTSAAQTLKISNTGSAPLTISSSTIAGANGSDFAKASDQCTGQSVAAGASCTVGLTFSPAGAGGRTASIAFADDASGSPHTVALSGVGTTSATILGTVSSRAGTALAPASGIPVSICTYSTRAICVATATDSSGRYRATDLPAGSYQVEVLPRGGALFGGSSVVQAGVGENQANFILQTQRPLDSGLSLNGQSGGATQTFWQSASVLAVPVSIATGQAAGTYGTTTINFWADPVGGSPIGATHGGLTVVYKYDAGGKPRLVSIQAKTTAPQPASPTHPSLGTWTTSVTGDLAVGDDISTFKVQGQLTPPPGGPYFHGAQEFLVNYFSIYSATAPSTAGSASRATAAGLEPTSGQQRSLVSAIGSPLSLATRLAASGGGECDPPVSVSDNGKVTLPGGVTWDPSTGTVHRADGSEMYVAPPSDQSGQNPHQGLAGMTADGTPIPLDTQPTTYQGNTDALSTPAPSVILPGNDPSGSDEVWIDTSDGPSAGRYGFSPDGSFVDLNTGIKYNPDGSPQGQTNAGRPNKPCPPQPLPPKPPKTPPPGNGGGSGGNYIDPSGVVRTPAHVPISGATVTLSSAAAKTGPFTTVPNGSTVMSPNNRRNPDRTTALGLFGWDVLPGFYRVTAKARGCTAVKGKSTSVQTDTLTIPPPVFDLQLVLKCPNLRRAITQTNLHASKFPSSQVVVTATVKGKAGRHPLGTVRFSSGHHVLGDVPVDRKTGKATLTAVAKSTHGLKARYLGDGLNAPSAG